MLKTNQSVREFFKSLLRSIDGTVVVSLSLFSVGLFLLDGIVLLTGFSPFPTIWQWDTQWDVLLLFVPFMCLVSYVWLNMAFDYGRIGQIVNAIILSIFPCGIILKSLQII